MVYIFIGTNRKRSNGACISPDKHEKVFRWLYQLSKTAPYDIKTTAAQHYRRVVLQEKMRDHEIAKGEIHYGDSITTDLASRQDGLKRAPKGVNDGNGFAFISHIGDSLPSGLFQS